MTQHLIICGIGDGMDNTLGMIKSMGVELTVITNNVTAYVMEYADRIIEVYPRDRDAVLSKIAMQPCPAVDAVFSLGYEAPWTVASLSEHFSCRGTSREVAMNCFHKNRRIALLKQAGVNVPDYEIVYDLQAAAEAIARMGLPVIVKPNDKTSSIGVLRIDQVEHIAACTAEARAHSADGCLLVEKYLLGSEHTVEGFMLAGKLYVTGISDRNYSEKDKFSPYQFENGDTLPSRLAGENIASMLKMTEKAVIALGLEGEVFSTDMLITSDGKVYVLEVACRMAGSRFGSEIVPLATGVNILPNAIRLCLGRDISHEELQPKFSRNVISRFLPSQEGTVVSIGELDSLKKNDGVYDVFWEQNLKPGDKTPAYKSGKDIIAGVIVISDSLQLAEIIANRVLNNLPLEIKGRGHA